MAMTMTTMMMKGHLVFNISHRLDVRPQGKDGIGKTGHTVTNLQKDKASLKVKVDKLM